MSDYIQDPNNSKKQVPGNLPDNAYDRFGNPDTGSYVKTPNAVIFGDVATDVPNVTEIEGLISISSSESSLELSNTKLVFNVLIVGLFTRSSCNLFTYDNCFVK